MEQGASTMLRQRPSGLCLFAYRVLYDIVIDSPSTRGTCFLVPKSSYSSQSLGKKTWFTLLLAIRANERKFKCSIILAQCSIFKNELKHCSFIIHPQSVAKQVIVPVFSLMHSCYYQIFFFIFKSMNTLAVFGKFSFLT